MTSPLRQSAAPARAGPRAAKLSVDANASTDSSQMAPGATSSAVANAPADSQPHHQDEQSKLILDALGTALPEEEAFYDQTMTTKRLHDEEAVLLDGLRDRVLAAQQKTRESFETRPKIPLPNLKTLAEKAAQLDKVIPNMHGTSAKEREIPNTTIDLKDKFYEMLGRVTDMYNGQLDAYYSKGKDSIADEVAASSRWNSEEEKLRYKTREADDASRIRDLEGEVKELKRQCDNKQQKIDADRRAMEAHILTQKKLEDEYEVLQRQETYWKDRCQRAENSVLDNFDQFMKHSEEERRQADILKEQARQLEEKVSDSVYLERYRPGLEESIIDMGT